MLAKLRILFVVFAMFKAPIYTRLLALQLMHFEYLIDISHPIIQILLKNPSSLVAEDVELSIMLLANSTVKTNLPVGTDSMHNAYIDLGILNKAGHSSKEDLASLSRESKKLPWRLTYNSTDQEVEATITFFFANWKEYALKRVRAPF